MKNEFDQRVVHVVGEYWAKYQRALHLAVLGSALRKQFDVGKQTNGTKLTDYIRIALKDSIQLVQNPKDRLVWGLIPNSVQMPAVDKLPALFEIPTSATAPTEMVDKKLWAAFSVPVAEGKRRWVHFEPQMGFSDLPQGTDAGAGHYEVPNNLIIPAGLSAPIDRSAQLSRNINEWLSTNRVEVNITQEKRASGGRTLLDLMINCLSAEQLSQTSMRLDVVKKLMDTTTKQ